MARALWWGLWHVTQPNAPLLSVLQRLRDQPIPCERTQPAFSGSSSPNFFCRIWQSLHCVVVTAFGETTAGFTIARSGNPSWRARRWLPPGPWQLAPYRAIRHLGADRLTPGTSVGHVAVQALHKAVPKGKFFTLKLVWVRAVWDEFCRESSDPILCPRACRNTTTDRYDIRRAHHGSPWSMNDCWFRRRS